MLVVLFGVLVLYWVLASSRLAGFIMSFLCNKLLLPSGDTGSRRRRCLGGHSPLDILTDPPAVSIGAVNFSFVQGRLAFGSLYYTTKNSSLSVVSGFVTLRYWRRNVRTALKNPERLPARLDIKVSGVEFQVPWALRFWFLPVVLIFLFSGRFSTTATSSRTW